MVCCCRFDSKNTKRVYFKEISTTKEHIRFPLQRMVNIKDVKEGDTVKIIYNLDERRKLGLWYDCVVRSVQLNPRQLLVGDIIYGRERFVKENCIVTSVGCMFIVSDSYKQGTVFFCR